MATPLERSDPMNESSTSGVVTAIETDHSSRCAPTGPFGRTDREGAP